MKFLGALGLLFAIALLIPPSRGWLLEVWGRFLVGGNLSAVIAAFLIVFVMGVVIASEERL